MADSSAEGRSEVALVSVSASERQIGDAYLDTYDEFRNRLAALHIEHLEVLRTIAYWDISFWDIGLFGGDAEMVARERLIHETLFPNIPFSWSDFAGRAGISSESVRVTEAKRWRNAFCDRQMFWAHDHHRRDVFVTSDGNFRERLNRSPDFSSARIATPEEAVRLL